MTVTSYEITLTLVTDNQQQATRAAEAVNLLATGFLFEGVHAATSFESADDYFDDENTDQLEAADTDDDQ